MVVRRDSLGARLRALRKQAGLSQVELARAVGRHQTAIGPYERDEYAPSREVVNRFAQVLETTPEFLLFGREPGTTSFAVHGAIGPGGMVGRTNEPMARKWLELKDRRMVIFEIGDDSMAPVIRLGSKILLAAEPAPYWDEFWGRDVLAELTDGRQLLRQLLPGPSAERVTLRAYNADIMHGVEIDAVQPVLGVFDPAVFSQIGRQEIQ